MSTIVPPSLKTCTRCQKPKPLTDFAPDGRRRDDLRPYCKECGKHPPSIAPWLKECSRCGRILSTQAFFRTSKSRDGLSYYCRECDANDRPALKREKTLTVKKCSKCQEVKPVSEFHKDQRHSDRLRSKCKDCCSQSQTRLKPPVESGHKICTRCKQSKPLCNFYRTKQNKQDGHRSICIDCGTGRRRDRTLRNLYNISLKDYEELFAAQGGVCAVCKRAGNGARNGKDFPLAVDHCHTTGAVRGLLCSSCNTALGMVKEDPKIIEALLQYTLERVLY